MKLFNELDFKAHSVWEGGKQARISFENGYGASVISGGGSYTSDENPYELAVLYDGAITYNTGITSDVIGNLNAKGVNTLLGKIKNLQSN
tara:strand:- start:7619 stop:7888 length:270 start_codon:yes stop_codon:yes gene_type:complete